MLGNSHKATAVALAPLFLLPIKTPFEAINMFFTTHNSYIEQLHSLSRGELGANIFILVISALVFARLPDIDLRFKAFLPKEKRHLRYLYHRQETHGILVWLIIWIVGIGYISGRFNIFVSSAYIGFIAGGITHIFGDILTGSVPIGFRGHYGKKWERFGIVSFFPKSMHTLFTEKLSAWFEQNLWVWFIIGGFVYYCVISKIAAG